jgi:hypothetical protein
MASTASAKSFPSMPTEWMPMAARRRGPGAQDLDEEDGQDDFREGADQGDKFFPYREARAHVKRAGSPGRRAGWRSPAPIKVPKKAMKKVGTSWTSTSLTRKEKSGRRAGQDGKRDAEPVGRGLIHSVVSAEAMTAAPSNTPRRSAVSRLLFLSRTMRAATFSS